MIQLEFFETEEESEMRSLREEVKAQRITLDKMRKALFARNGELVKITYELREDLEVIKRGLCNGK